MLRMVLSRLTLIALSVHGVWAARRKARATKNTYDPDYNCDGQGGNECGNWDYWKAKCKNGNTCSYQYRFGDSLLSHSCRCQKQVGAPTHYDCNGDGVKDCGDWSYSTARCASGHKCEYAYQFGDTTFDKSCRCKAECLTNHKREESKCAPQPTDYDCDGDGQDNCGKWDYPSAKCQNMAMCSYKYKFGDGLLGQSCRCRPCARITDSSSAAADRALVPNPDSNVVGSTQYWERWVNWADHESTCAPWMMPQSDSDLRKLLAYAQKKNYLVRPSGAGHSAGGLVTDGDDGRVLVVSLGGYKAPDPWEYRLDMKSKRVTVNAGWSQLDLYERIRPLNLFLPTSTAGYFFQLAGVVANTVHGAGYQKSFVHSYVTKMRVMLFDGSIKIISEKSELRFWRNSYGLLGIILGLEFQLEENVKYQMFTTTKTLPSWSRQAYWDFILKDAEADLPASLSGGASSGGSRKSSAGEFFINLLADPPTMIVYENKVNGNATQSGYASGIPSNVAQNYQKVRNEKVEKSASKDKITYGESIRKEGCPALYLDPFQLINVNKLVGTKLVPTIARVINPLAFSAQTIKKLPDLIESQRDSANDGFFAVKAPNTLIAAYFIKPEKSFEAMDFMRTSVKARNGQATWFEADGFSWNQPAEFRFMTVTDDAVLQPVPPGFWFVSEILSFPDSAATDQAWKEAFKEIEDYWINELGAIPHMGKLFGFEQVGDTIELFQDRKVCRVYSSETKSEFKAYQSRVDPKGLFNYGLGSRALQSC